MSFSSPNAGTIAYSAASGTSVAPTYPTPIANGDCLILIVGQKPTTANGGTVTTPSGWTLRGSLTGAGGYGATLGIDTGNTNLFIYTKDVVSGTESGTLTVTVGDNNVCWAILINTPVDQGSLSYEFTSGSDVLAGALSITGSGNLSVIGGDLVFSAFCMPTDVTTPAQFSAHVVSIGGASVTSTTEIGEPDSATGNDIGGVITWSQIGPPSATAAPTWDATTAGTTTNVRGPGIFLRIRELRSPSPVHPGSLFHPFLAR